MLPASNSHTSRTVEVERRYEPVLFKTAARAHTPAGLRRAALTLQCIGHKGVLGSDATSTSSRRFLISDRSRSGH